jgi:hypothetical protein
MLKRESKYAPYDAQIRKMAKNGLKVKDAVEELGRLGMKTATHDGLGTYSSATARPPIRWNLSGRSVYAPFDRQIREMAKLGFSLRKVVEELRRLGLVTGTRQALHLYLQRVEPKIAWRSRVLPSMYKAYDEKIRKMAMDGWRKRDALEELRHLGLKAATFYGLKTYSYEIARPPIRWSRRGWSSYAPYEVLIRKLAADGLSCKDAAAELRKHAMKKANEKSLRAYSKRYTRPKIFWHGRGWPFRRSCTVLAARQTKTRRKRNNLQLSA